ncbi:NPAS1 isoform 7 [Pan troglodytes]|uniref:Neuronal PAS domain protein 1 n=2 Tax=Homininae TaxID=207598 RepID=M0QX32_HUMAN|nr:neuronal PAS domain protein 1 [Homo sapiens]PNI28912.1 NPAS1 isoform 7 [Pan troglodytes]
MTGSSVFDYIHPGDHSEVLEQLGLRTPTPGPPTPPSVSSSSSSSSSLADTPEIESATTWTWGPQSWWAAAATSLSTDRTPRGSARATWTCWTRVR